MAIKGAKGGKSKNKMSDTKLLAKGCLFLMGTSIFLIDIYLFAKEKREKGWTNECSIPF